MSTPEEFITVKEAIKLMKVSAWKMTKLLDAHEFTVSKTARDKRKKLLRRSEVEEWIQRAEQPMVVKEEESLSHVAAA